MCNSAFKSKPVLDSALVVVAAQLGRLRLIKAGFVNNIRSDPRREPGKVLDQRHFEEALVQTGGLAKGLKIQEC